MSEGRPDSGSRSRSLSDTATETLPGEHPGDLADSTSAISSAGAPSRASSRTSSGASSGASSRASSRVRSELFLIGLNHTTATLGLREKLVFRSKDLTEALQALRDACGLEECVLLSTCNRTEVYGVGPEEAAGRALGFLAVNQRIEREELRSHVYLYRGLDVVRRLCRVAAGLDSMIVGEGQVLAQVKGAFETAQEAGATGPLLSMAFRQALTTGKRSRTETEISRRAVSISHAAVELAQQIFGQLSGCRALVLGAGEMSEITLKLLRDAGMKTSIMISNRTPERAHDLARRCQGVGVEWDQFPAALRDADIVIVSTSAPHVIVRTETIRNAMKARRGRHMFLIDISVPRNVEPSAGDLPDVFLYNIDDLRGVVERNLGSRRSEIEKVERIVGEETDRFGVWQKSLDVAPAIVELRNHAERVRQEEWNRCLARLSLLSERDRKAAEVMTRQLVNRALHPPMSRLKELGASGQGCSPGDLEREIFELQDLGPLLQERMGEYLILRGGPVETPSIDKNHPITQPSLTTGPSVVSSSVNGGNVASSPAADSQAAGGG